MKKITQWLQRFMAGRYGTDKLNMALLWTAVIIMVISIFIPNGWVRLGFSLAYYALLVWSLYRSFSRQTYKRYQENRKYLMFLERLKDRQHRYYNCPKCRQRVRVPRGKGKVAITCPRCKERFIRKS